METCLKKPKKMAKNSELRQKRKEDHLKMAVALPPGPKETGLDDIEFYHQAVGNASLDSISTKRTFLEKELNAPLLIEAITGGTPMSYEINKTLAKAAAKVGVAIAVGSQTAGLEDQSMRDTFAVVRENNPNGVVLANISAGAPADMAQAAVDMIAADGLQLHLNLTQELFMEEGDRDFSKALKNIRHIATNVSVPVIVKEVGFGISSDMAIQLYGAGIKHLDVGGAGGTNFAAIENERRKIKLNESLVGWGIPTALSTAECTNLGLPIKVIASGGIKNGLEVAKCISLGAELAGAANPFLKAAIDDQGEERLVGLLEEWILELKMTILMTGANRLDRLKYAPLIISGEAKNWMKARKINWKKYANRMI